MASVATLSRRSVHPAAFESAPSAPAYPVYSSSPLADCCPKPDAASYPPMTCAQVGAPPAAVAPVPCPASPFEAAPSARPSVDAASSCSFAPPTPSAGSYAAAQPSVAAGYPSAHTSAAYTMPPPAPAAQFTYAPADDKVRPNGCFNCSPEVGAAIGTVLGGTLAVVGVVCLELLRWAIIFA